MLYLKQCNDMVMLLFSGIHVSSGMVGENVVNALE
jgi:hypothetical protein